LNIFWFITNSKCAQKKPSFDLIRTTKEVYFYFL
jgi:hypothetical protein